LSVTGEINSEGDSNNIGGMFGMVEANGGQILIEKVYAAVDITSISDYDVGGLIGEAETDGSLSNEASLIIQDAYATGDVYTEDDYDAGGLVGHIDLDEEEGQELELTIRRAYASGSVTAYGEAAGLVGFVESNGGDGVYLIEDSFATGSVTGLNDD